MHVFVRVIADTKYRNTEIDRHHNQLPRIDEDSTRFVCIEYDAALEELCLNNFNE